MGDDEDRTDHFAWDVDYLKTVIQPAPVPVPTPRRRKRERAPRAGRR